jgi:carboxylesterase type B
VYIFIQGGGFNANSNPNYDGSGLVVAGNMGMIVVTFNYRVGLYGFLTSKEVQADGDLNIGLLDQRKVFQWVQRHILLVC